MRVAGVLHDCLKDNRKKFFNPNVFPECPACGEDMTNKAITMYDVCGVKRS